MDKNTFFITTPIYYPSGNWHIGHCYTTVVCDAIARFNRMLKKDVFFLTGTDEHGQKIEKKAQEKGLTPIEFINPLVDGLKDIWKELDVSYDKFIRTTDDYHVKGVQRIFKQLYDKGEIYKSEYEGWYCTPCESFWTESQLKDGKCPDCGRPVQKGKEESYFFRLSKYADRILKLYEDNPEFLQPKSRVNEMVNNFIKPGLQDLCVSRTTIKWGIPVTFDEKHTVYVWVDALTNYITALGYGSDDDSLYQKYWPANLQMVGKEIVRFHTIIWPAILMALDIPVPNRVYGHGWLLIGGDKLSKSKGENIKTEITDPKELVDRYGCDALRYFLLREIPFGNDGVYTNESLLKRINGDLSNALGNLVSRTTAMINQYFGGVLPNPTGYTDLDNEVIAIANGVLPLVKKNIDAIDVPTALGEIFKLIERANKYIDETEPWKLGKDPAMKDRLSTVMYVLAECIRIATILLKPFITKAPDKILSFFSIDGSLIKDFDTVKFGELKGGTAVIKAEPVFPRIDINKEIQEIEKMMTARHKEAQKAEKERAKAEAKVEEKVEEKPEISIDEFFKTELRVALVKACEKVEKSNKLLKLTLDVGDEERTVASGLANYYKPEELIGKKVILVYNLKPAKLCGVVSQGMVLCAEKDGKVVIVTPEQDMPAGAVVC
ncbi:MAG: methionine--tRNA ligase [Clostridia bacterium]|nr:methionine--tRNA ligase [Clostridia bacterium]